MPEIRFVCGDFGAYLGPFIKELRGNLIAANVCGYYGHKETQEEPGADVNTRIAKMAVVVLGAVKD